MSNFGTSGSQGKRRSFLGIFGHSENMAQAWAGLPAAVSHISRNKIRWGSWQRELTAFNCREVETEESPQPTPLDFKGPDLHHSALALYWLGKEFHPRSWTSSIPFYLFGIDSLLFFKGLNPGKAIAEIKKMMATYKEKKASA